MAEHFGDEIRLGDEERWGQYILGGIAFIIMICGPIGAGIWCASTAYASNPAVKEGFDATVHTIFGK